MGEISSWAFPGLMAVSLLWTIQLTTTCPLKCMCQNSTEVSNITSVTCAQRNLSTVPIELPRYLNQLNLSGNSISSLGEELASLRYLKHLDLSFNSLLYLDTFVFDTLENLLTLNLSQNKILNIPSTSFANLSSIQEINLSQNNLNELDNETFLDLSTLQKLNLHNNSIISVEINTFSSLGKLMMLDLSNNNLTELDQTYFSGLSSLQELLLQHNNIAYITKEVFLGLLSLKYLDLSHNIIATLNSFTFSSVPSLNCLTLNDNRIHNISQDFMGNSAQLTQLMMDSNRLANINIPVFKGLDKLNTLSLSKMPSLTKIAFNAFHGLPSLQILNLSHNPNITLLHPHLFDELPELDSVDLSYNNLSTLSQLTFHSNLKLETAYLQGNQFLCNCGLAWLADQVSSNSTIFGKDLQCFSESLHLSLNLYKDTNLTEMCYDIGQVNVSSVLYFAIGSSAHLKCEFEADEHTVVIWTTPRRLTLTYHAFHPDVTSHLLTEADLALNSSYHATHYWHKSSNYYSSLRNNRDRIILLKDGSLFIDYVLRSDNGPYTCLVMNANDNSSAEIWVKLDYGVLFNVKIMSIVVGISAALSMFLLNLIFSIIGAIARRLVNKRRREAIRKLLENLDTYKTTQFSKLRENYSLQLSRIRDQYHHQFHRLSDNYRSQMKRVRRGCSHQVERIRDNYTIQVGRLRNYSSHQIEQIREMYNNQLLKIRDYGSLQMVRIHEKYKLQQQHVIKLLETMNLDNCKTVIETECLRTESMIFGVDLLKDSETTPLAPLSGSDSEYMTATSSENSSQDSLRFSPSPEDHRFDITTEVAVDCNVLNAVAAEATANCDSFVINFEGVDCVEKATVQESTV